MNVKRGDILRCFASTQLDWLFFDGGISLPFDQWKLWRERRLVLVNYTWGCQSFFILLEFTGRMTYASDEWAMTPPNLISNHWAHLNTHRMDCQKNSLSLSLSLSLALPHSTFHSDGSVTQISQNLSITSNYKRSDRIWSDLIRANHLTLPTKRRFESGNF